ncbi:hypothetical protein [Pelodictyon luteolum]|uniref:Uncharacterized protein n=1 Tax=Chlorobium luteolum (strain DSM 273 / BCRC 81028 / 2530) TaxID=319225 RepID=Q3B677_CHLL3|nr:hypothetical protein [Pelodictyon luteolum]ABB23154.1 conserved hypothetical protein [Pelodictyon luteolum DSM 273]
MANISLYVSGQTELADVTEFFQKQLLGEGEQPIAFFDGVFYESHQERVGNIAFQDYLIYSDRAVYLWARGASKDYLDRFELSAVTVNSRNKDSAFATLNLKIRREEKEPVYVIFDMVEIQEAELIIRMHTVMESVIEEHLGTGFRKPVPDAIAHRLLDAGRSICIPRQFTIALDAPSPSQQDSSIGYGQDLLEQYKASIGYPPGEALPGQQPGQGSPRGQQGRGANQPSGPFGGLENMLPTDPASLKRIAGSIKDLVGEAPFKLRDQVMKDLQHVPGDVATVLTAVNELVANIAGNPQAERFVMTAIKTAVRNDGVLGSIGKMIKVSGIGGGSRKQQPQRQEGGAPGGGRFEDDEDNTIRRKKISIRDEEPRTGRSDFDFKDDAFEVPPMNDAPPLGRKKIKIQADEGDVPALVKDMMDMDRPADECPEESGVGEVRRKKIKIMEAEGENAPETASEDAAQEAVFPPVRKKISVRVAGSEEEPILPEDVLLDALGEPAPEKKDAGCYGTIESDPLITAPEAQPKEES